MPRLPPWERWLSCVNCKWTFGSLQVVFYKRGDFLAWASMSEDDLGGKLSGDYFFLFHRARAALSAISDRCFGDKFAALALPPFMPPKRPSATAAGFLPFG